MSLIKTYKKVPKLETRTLKHDWTGARRGKLTIKYPIRRDGKHLHWLAECDCGTQVEVIGHQIELSSSLSSCGRCQTMKRITLPELPYTLYDDKIPEQKELPLEEDYAEDKGLTEALEEIYSEPEPSPTTAWDIAGKCCAMLEPLGKVERIKAVQLIRVQLGYDL